MFLLEYNFDSKAKRLREAKKVVCLKHVPGIQIVASVKIKIATVESAPPSSPPPSQQGTWSRKKSYKKFDQGTWPPKKIL